MMRRTLNSLDEMLKLGPPRKGVPPSASPRRKLSWEDAKMPSRLVHCSSRWKKL